MAAVMYALVEWESTGSIYLPQYSLVDSTIIAHRSVDEVHTGRLVEIMLNGSLRRGKVISISANYRALEEQMLELQTLRQRQDVIASDDTFTPSLDATIQRLKSALDKRKQRRVPRYVVNESGRNSVHNPQPSTSQATAEQLAIIDSIKPTFIANEEDKNRLNDLIRIMYDISEPGDPSIELDRLSELVQIKMEYVFKIFDDFMNPWDTVATDDSHVPTVQPEVTSHPVIASTPTAATVKRRASSHDNDTTVTDDENDMVRIGTGETAVPSHVMSQIDWRSHTIATRKLLMAVFPRKILATHSLTGKCSPAFSNKPAKLCLDKNKIKDIVITVSERCGVSTSLVRSAITTKCADENKMFRTRETKKQENKRLKVENQENIPPPTEQQGDSSNNETVSNNETKEK